MIKFALVLMLCTLIPIGCGLLFSPVLGDAYFLCRVIIQTCLQVGVALPVFGCILVRPRIRAGARVYGHSHNE